MPNPPTLQWGGTIVTLLSITSHTTSTLFPGHTITSAANVIYSPTTCLPTWVVQNQLMFTPFATGNLYYHSIPDTVTTVTQPAFSYHQCYPSQAVPTNFGMSTLPSLADTGRPWRAVADHRQLAAPAVQRGRHALRRSIDLFRRLRPAEEIKTFLAGRPLIVHGHRFDYRIKKHDNLLQHTTHPHSAHIPYDLHLVDRETNRPLAKGCIVIPSTPVVDQVLALILSVEDVDEELVVINTTNWSPGLPAGLIAARSRRITEPELALAA